MEQLFVSHIFFVVRRVVGYNLWRIDKLAVFNVGDRVAIYLVQLHWLAVCKTVVADVCQLYPMQQ